CRSRGSSSCAAFPADRSRAAGKRFRRPSHSLLDRTSSDAPDIVPQPRVHQARQDAMRNLEAKFRLGDLDAARAAALGLGYTARASFIQRDTFFVVARGKL